jgi:hypothetical protein
VHLKTGDASKQETADSTSSHRMIRSTRPHLQGTPQNKGQCGLGKRIPLHIIFVCQSPQIFDVFFFVVVFFCGIQTDKGDDEKDEEEDDERRCERKAITTRKALFFVLITLTFGADNSKILFNK